MAIKLHYVSVLAYVICMFSFTAAVPASLAQEGAVPTVSSVEQISSVGAMPLEELESSQLRPAIPEAEGVVLQGSANTVLRRKESISIAVESLISSEFSRIGDEIVGRILVPASITEPSLVALRGGEIRGNITALKPSRNAGRAGSMKVVFNRLILPDKRSYPINAELNTELFKGQEAIKMVVEDVKLIGLGALWGTMNSLKWVPVAAFTTHGLSLAVGAGVGMSMGLIGAMRRDGEVRTLHPGERQSVEFPAGLTLPDDVIREVQSQNQLNERKIAGLSIKPLMVERGDSPNYEETLSVKVSVQNHSSSDLYPCDLLLWPRDGARPIRSDLRSTGIHLLKSVKAGESREIALVFPVQGYLPINEYDLAWQDPLDGTKLYSVPLKDAHKFGNQ